VRPLSVLIPDPLPDPFPTHPLPEWWGDLSTSQRLRCDGAMAVMRFLGLLAFRRWPFMDEYLLSATAHILARESRRLAEAVRRFEILSQYPLDPHRKRQLAASLAASEALQHLISYLKFSRLALEAPRETLEAALRNLIPDPEPSK